MSLVDLVASRLDLLVPEGQALLVAVSGGPDSLALWDLLVLGEATHRRRLVAAHVDHGIAGESAIVAEQVARVIDATGHARLVRHLAMGPLTSETAARVARRAALRAMAAEADAGAILLAHHAEDQMETVLLRLLRGSGPAGLAGMASRRGIWVRPLLDISRDALGSHLRSRGIAAWNDPANRNPKHLRSWLRSTVVPVLAERLPDLTEQLLLARRHAAKARRGWDDVVKHLPDLSLQQEKRGISVAAPALNGYSSALRHAVLGTLGRRFGVLLGERRLGAIDRLLAAAEGGRVALSVRLEAEYAFGRLTLRRPMPAATASPVPLAEGTECGSVRFGVREESSGLVTRQAGSTWLMPGHYLVRAWRAGDRMRPLGGAGTRPVAVLLKEARVSPGRRSHWPVVVDARSATIVWVPGICRSDAMIPEAGAAAIHVECRDT